MVEHNKMILLEKVRAQAILRARLGISVCVSMLLCTWYGGPATSDLAAWHIVLAFGLHIIYNASVLLAVRPALRPRPALLNKLTAIMDSLLLSLGLALMGEVGQLFTCFYLFTVLGFGFRIGARTPGRWPCARPHRSPASSVLRCFPRHGSNTR